MVSRLAALLFLASCGTEVIHEPGDTKLLNLRVTFSDNAGLGSIGSFVVVLSIDGADETYHLSFNPSARALSWVSEPEGLPATGELYVRMRAVGINGGEMMVGGTAGPVDLDSVEFDSSVDLPILVTPLDQFTNLQTTLAYPRFGHTTSRTTSGGVLIFGGASGGTPAAPTSFVTQAEWIDILAGVACASDEACFGGASVPPPRTAHIAVALPPGCPQRIIVGLGADDTGTALPDLHLFDPEALAFSEITTPTVTARIDAMAFATHDCHLVIAGGHDGAGTTVSTVDILLVTESGVSSVSAGGEILDPATSGAAVLQLGNNVDEVILASGQQSGGTPTDRASAISFSMGQIDVCNVGEVPACIGEVGTLACARSNPRGAVLPWHGDIVPALIVGDDGTCGDDEVELFRAGTQHSPFNRFVSVTTAPATALETNRASGHTVVAIGEGTALVIGGIETGSAAPTSAVERFILAEGLTETATSATGDFDTLDPLPQGNARAYHTAIADDHKVLIFGGWDGFVPLGSISAFAPLAGVEPN